ncbi:uncharacterized protein LOC115218431 [Octopus sinensis]|uniref:Uncharacterized protein LOC115218431 n=1 Tax=Octopus sinensis TaxID=2607531 RepID=A0A6P7T105_9MOLL|nr:uncharacterized protein LOC115218431 [Octopus sinensis]
MELITGIMILLKCLDLAFAAGCKFPVDWQGVWYINGRGEIRIGATNISYLGECIQEKEYKYKLHDKTRNCYQCIVFTNRTSNLIEYKSGYCHNTEDFRKLCSTITGDSQLHSLVRVPSVPVPCPFQGSYFFRYMNGSVNCSKPFSQMRECADNSRFKFHFRKCNGNPETTEKVLDFQCLATWNNGDKMLYGKFTGDSLSADQNMYRCMIHDFYASEGLLAMSIDASCQGPQSPQVGPFTMELQRNNEATKAYRQRQPCRFLEEFASIHKWKDLTGRYIIEVEDNMNVFRIKDNIHGLSEVPRDCSHGPKAFPYEVRRSEIRLVSRCVSLKEGTKNTFLTYTTNDSCVSKYQCVKIELIARSFFKMVIGSPYHNDKDACKHIQLVKASTLYLLPAESKPSPCPLPGTYAYKDFTSHCVGSLIIGCHNENEIEIQASCPSMHKAVEIVQCLFSWGNEHILHLITQKPTTGTRTTGYCLTFADSLDAMDLYSDPTCSSDNLMIMNKTLRIHLTKPEAKCVTQKEHTASSNSQHQQGETNIITVGKGGSHELINGVESKNVSHLQQFFILIISIVAIICLQSGR